MNKRIKAALIDLSGTLHIENLAIPGSVEALRRLRDAGIAVRFVTNTTKESKRVLVQRLTNCGFQISPSEIFTSLTAARDLVESRGLRPLLLLEDAALEDFEGISSEHDHNAVVIGLAPSRFDYANLNKAFRLVMDGAELIAIHKSRYFAQNDGLSLGPGPFATALEFATGKTATVVGKPEKNFFLSALKDLNCSPSETVMIGDDAKGDVEGALRAGLQAVLVQTGKYRENDKEKLLLKPTTVSKSFPKAVDWILNSE